MEMLQVAEWPTLNGCGGRAAVLGKRTLLCWGMAPRELGLANMPDKRYFLLLQQADGTSHCCPQWFYFSSFYIPSQVQNYTVERTKKPF